MPQPNRKRGRRMEGKKRKHEDAEDDEPQLEQSSSKRRKSADFNGEQDFIPMDGYDESLDAAYPAREKAFFGLLDEEEQEYFRQVGDQLKEFPNEVVEDWNQYLCDVYREADGKELKLAQSQASSRVLERMIQMSTPAQLKSLFQKFSGNFIHLVSHRFASHCCEALFLQATPSVTEEVLASSGSDQTNGANHANEDDADVSMESLFLNVLGELEGSVGYLLTDRYASHVLRVLLLILAGEPIDSASTKHRSQDKSKHAYDGQDQPHASAVQGLDAKRSAPDSFTQALQGFIASSVAGLDTEKLRALATHPHGNPALQLLLKLDLTHFGKQRAKEGTSILRTLLPDDPITADSNSAVFINGLVYDPVGSHLVERVLENAPGNIFKSLYYTFFKERLPSHARSEIAGHVVCRILPRLNHDELLEAHEILVPGVSDLLRKNRTVVIRKLIECCTHLDIDTQAIAVQIDATWHGKDGFEIRKLLKFGQEAVDEPRSPHDSAQSSMTDAAAAFFARSTESIKAHFNVLAQAMLLVPGSLSALVLDSLVALDAVTLLQMSKDQIVSRTLQAALTTRNASMITTRKLIQHFYGYMGEMALDTGASHVVDCMWEGTHGLAFIRERIAEELAENESNLRDNPYGRAVWKNWKMDMYKRRRQDWIRQSKNKASNDGFQSFSELDTNKDKGVSAKTPLQLARERHAQGKGKKKGKGKDKDSSTRKSRGGPKADSTPAATATAST